jgi:hypothetical protein
MEEQKAWRFCVVGNIKSQHTDENGKILYGTKAFSGGTKVYIDDRTWNVNAGEVSVIGLNRFGHYAVEGTETDLIENIRVQRVFKPTVLEIMDYLEMMDGWPWRGRTAADKRTLDAFVEAWKNRKP